MNNVYAFLWGGTIAILGGLIGLGGAEFRLPILVGIFKYRTLQAIVINLSISLVTVAFSFLFRTGFGNLNPVIENSSIIFNMLAGSFIGAYIGANFATRINEHTLTRIVISFLFILSIVLVSHELIADLPTLQLAVPAQIAAGFFAGIAIGIFSSMLGVAGGELIIPTIVLVFAKDIKLAGTLSLAISIPTILIGLVKYQRQGNLSGITTSRGFILWMAGGSILGALIGSYLLQFISSSSLYILLGLVLFISALRIRTHQKNVESGKFNPGL